MLRTASCLLLVVVVVFVGNAQASLLINGGFETVETYGGGFPSSFGKWQRNVSHVTSAENRYSNISDDE